MTDQTKEVIGLLEAASGDEGTMIHFLEVNQYTGEIPKGISSIRKILIALALTKLHEAPEPKCKTCGDARKVEVICRPFDEEIPQYIPCPDCQQPPPAGEFTKEIRRSITLFKKRSEERRKQEPEMNAWPLDSFVHEDQVLEVCARLDSETQRADKAEAKLWGEKKCYEAKRQLASDLADKWAEENDKVKQLEAKLKEQPSAGELKLDECNIYLMNSELCLPLGDFKAKIMIMCPNQDVMDKMKELLKKCDRLDRAESSKADLKADLIDMCESALRFGLNPQLEKTIKVAIAKAKKER